MCFQQSHNAAGHHTTGNKKTAMQNYDYLKVCGND
jgi:hypothetical protein